jgi:hypothetical protein
VAELQLHQYSVEPLIDHQVRAEGATNDVRIHLLDLRLLCDPLEDSVHSAVVDAGSLLAKTQ